ncbi:hypothetical protein Ahy_A10g048138 isoform A [Arachis hypogaea]|uniref:Uroporphyrinogen decarboxylase (URO-D) domain-containing protein n=1 Tax=Arachis hypogaea TaxID=3818 RepID=A0A445B4B6_ARAHY|nr:hypothetical protein Ahy_A10g048138 isoform A [Arachis hypogaea]
MREEEVASVAAKPSLAGLGSPSPLSCVPPLVSGSPLCFCCNSPLSWPAWKEACATLQKLLSDPLLVKAARGEPVSRPSAWMMRQAGRPDGVIIFSDIRTPRPAFGVEFDIEDVRGPVIQSPIRSKEGLKALHPIDLEKLSFIGDSLKILRKEVGGDASVLGFMGAPWTIATYIVEGGTTRTYTTIKSILGLTAYKYLIHERWSNPYIKEIVDLVKKRCPETPIVLYINGNGGLLERMKDTGVDVIGLDWTVDMADRRSDLRFFLVLYVEQLPLKPRESTQAKLPHQLC